MPTRSISPARICLRCATGRLRERVDGHHYVRVNPRPDAQTVIEQLPGWLAHYNEVHPHRALGYRSPREYIAQTREAPSGL